MELDVGSLMPNFHIPNANEILQVCTIQSPDSENFLGCVKLAQLILSVVYLAGFAAAVEVAVLVAGAVLDVAAAAGLGLDAAVVVDGFGAAVLEAPAAEGVGLDAVRVGAAPT